MCQTLYISVIHFKDGLRCLDEVLKYLDWTKIVLMCAPVIKTMPGYIVFNHGEHVRILIYSEFTGLLFV